MHKYECWRYGEQPTVFYIPAVRVNAKDAARKQYAMQRRISTSEVLVRYIGTIAFVRRDPVRQVQQQSGDD